VKKMSNEIGKLTDQEIVGLITGAAIASVVPMSVLMRNMLESGAVDKQKLRLELEQAMNIRNLPPSLKEMLDPIWRPLLKICE
jgi:hypothetical protein